MLLVQKLSTGQQWDKPEDDNFEGCYDQRGHQRLVSYAQTSPS